MSVYDYISWVTSGGAHRNKNLSPQHWSFALWASTEYVVRAQGNEELIWWGLYSKYSATRTHVQGSWKGNYNTLEWNTCEKGMFQIVTCGYIGDHPICISVTWYRINKSLVMFYTDSSITVDWNIIEKWLKDNVFNYYGLDWREQHFRDFGDLAGKLV